MEKSIEAIWKNGFLVEESMLAPKISKLYQKKSNHIIDKMIRMMKFNVWGIYTFAVIIFFINLFIGSPWFVAAIVSSQFIIAGIYLQTRMKKLNQLDQGVNNYEYLIAFNEWLKQQTERNLKISRYFYPASVFASALIIWFAPKRELLMDKIIRKYPDSFLTLNPSITFFIVVCLSAILFSIFSPRIYMFDIKLIYGRVFQKLDEIIEDLEELRGDLNTEKDKY